MQNLAFDSINKHKQTNKCRKTDRWTQFFLFFTRRLEYTRDQLLEFKKQMDEKVGQGHGEEHGGGFGGFGGFGGGSTEVSFYHTISF